jgi:hypothetical protein
VPESWPAAQGSDLAGDERASYLTEDNTVYLGLDELWATLKVCQSLNGSIILHEIHICPERKCKGKDGDGNLLILEDSKWWQVLVSECQ